MKDKRRIFFALAAAGIVLMLLSDTYAEGILDKITKWTGNEGGGQEAVYKYLVVAVIYRIFFIYVYTWVFVIMRYCNSFPEHFSQVIVANPSFNASSASFNPGMSNMASVLIKLLIPFYLLAIALTAFYLLFSSGSPHGRAGAKSLLKRLIISMFFFSVSPYIAEILMATSQNLTQAILATADVNSVKEVLLGGVWGSFWIISKIAMTDLELGIPFWLSLYIMAWMPYVIICLRYILVTLFCMVFPLGVALYSFVFLRGLGRKILEQTLVWVYMQVFFALVIITIGAGIHLYDALPAPRIFSGVNVIPIPGGSQLFQFIFNALNIQVLSTNIIAFTLGAAANALIFAVPFMMVRLLNHFLP